MKFVIGLCVLGLCVFGLVAFLVFSLVQRYTGDFGLGDEKQEWSVDFEEKDNVS